MGKSYVSCFFDSQCSPVVSRWRCEVDNYFEHFSTDDKFRIQCVGQKRVYFLTVLF